MQALIDSLNRLTDVLDKLTSTKSTNLKSINININFNESNESNESNGSSEADESNNSSIEIPEIPEEMLNEEF